MCGRAAKSNPENSGTSALGGGGFFSPAVGYAPLGERWDGEPTEPTMLGSELRGRSAKVAVGWGHCRGDAHPGSMRSLVQEFGGQTRGLWDSLVLSRAHHEPTSTPRTHTLKDGFVVGSWHKPVEFVNTACRGGLRSHHDPSVQKPRSSDYTQNMTLNLT
jgi:hypothetical protein